MGRAALCAPLLMMVRHRQFCANCLFAPTAHCRVLPPNPSSYALALHDPISEAPRPFCFPQGINSMQLILIVNRIRSELLPSVSIGALLALPVITIASLAATIAEQLSTALSDQPEGSAEKTDVDVEPSYFWFTAAQVAFPLECKLNGGKPGRQRRV